MTLEDVDGGWWGAPDGPRWKCPECKVTTNVADWRKCSVWCDDCGERFDHVWGDTKILPPDEGGI